MFCYFRNRQRMIDTMSTLSDAITALTTAVGTLNNEITAAVALISTGVATQAEVQSITDAASAVSAAATTLNQVVTAHPPVA